MLLGQQTSQEMLGQFTGKCIIHVESFVVEREKKREEESVDLAEKILAASLVGLFICLVIKPDR